MMIQKIAMVLVLIGALNWGLVGVTNFFSARFDLVEFLAINLIGSEMIGDIIYIIVGAAAVLVAVTKCRDCGSCQPEKGGMQNPMQDSGA